MVNRFLLALESLQFQAGAHFAISGGALHVHGFHETAIVVDVHLKACHGRGDFAFAACADMGHHLFALVAHLGRYEYIRDDIDVFDFCIAEHEGNGHEILESMKLTVDFANEIPVAGLF